MSDAQAPRGPRGRTRGRRFDATVVAAAVLPLLVAGFATLVDADVAVTTGAAPTDSALTRASVVCPGLDAPVTVATTTGATGPVEVRSGDGEDDLDLAPDAVAEGDVGAGAAVVTGTGELAPGLVAGRFGDPLSAADCRVPVFDQWFTGVGAGPKHASVLELVNPDAGRAVVDVTLLGRNGAVDVPRLLGLAVPGRSTTRLDLATLVPRRDDLALRVQTLRGRVSAHLADSFDELGSGASGADWLASQDQPQSSNLLLGLPPGKGRRILVLANPGDDEGRATLRLVTGESVFAPSDAEDVVVPPQGVVRLSLASLLRRASGNGAPDTERTLGLQVDGTVPLTASLGMFLDGDLVHATPVPRLEESGTPGAAVLPGVDRDGRQQLILGGAGASGVATVTSYDADGEELDVERVELGAGRGETLDLPDDARLVTVEPSRAQVSAVVLVEAGSDGGGAAMVRVRQPAATGLVPQVGPALP